MRSCQAIIFDYDGTLVDLRADHGRMDALRADVRSRFGSFGVGLEFRPFYRDIDRAIARIENDDPKAAAAMLASVCDIVAHYERDFSEHSKPKSFAQEAWRAAMGSSPVGIVSNNAASLIAPTLMRHQIARADDHFALVGFEHVTRHKPDPQGISLIIRSLNLIPGHTAIYVGDHCDDLEACQRFNALGGSQLVPLIVRGGKCDWDLIIKHPYFRESLAVANLSEVLLTFANPNFGKWRDA
jgi:phosphoglycolate phosphatase-like HAD superfamily hydrolase